MTNINYLQVLPIGHCFKCHHDYDDRTDPQHPVHCTGTNGKPCTEFTGDECKPWLKKEEILPLDQEHIERDERKRIQELIKANRELGHDDHHLVLIIEDYLKYHHLRKNGINPSIQI